MRGRGKRFTIKIIHDINIGIMETLCKWDFFYRVMGRADFGFFSPEIGNEVPPKGGEGRIYIIFSRRSFWSIISPSFEVDIYCRPEA